MRREQETPNGLMEFLVARGIELLRERGVEEVSLNFAAFARFVHAPREPMERLAGHGCSSPPGTSSSSACTASTRPDLPPRVP
jgi:hypothetical protein